MLPPLSQEDSICKYTLFSQHTQILFPSSSFSFLYQHHDECDGALLPPILIK